MRSHKLRLLYKKPHQLPAAFRQSTARHLGWPTDADTVLYPSYSAETLHTPASRLCRHLYHLIHGASHLEQLDKGTVWHWRPERCHGIQTCPLSRPSSKVITSNVILHGDSSPQGPQQRCNLPVTAERHDPEPGHARALLLDIDPVTPSAPLAAECTSIALGKAAARHQPPAQRADQHLVCLAARACSVTEACHMTAIRAEAGLCAGRGGLLPALHPAPCCMHQCVRTALGAQHMAAHGAPSCHAPAIRPQGNQPGTRPRKLHEQVLVEERTQPALGAALQVHSRVGPGPELQQLLGCLQGAVRSRAGLGLPGEQVTLKGQPQQGLRAGGPGKGPELWHQLQLLQIQVQDHGAEVLLAGHEAFRQDQIAAWAPGEVCVCHLKLHTGVKSEQVSALPYLAPALDYS